MVTDEAGVRVAEVYRDDGLCVLTVSGELGVRSAAVLRRELAKAFTRDVPVVADVTGLTVLWAPAAHAFASVLQACGGWPSARLALAGANAALSGAVCGTATGATLHHAADIGTARRLLDRRPDRVARQHVLPAHVSSPGRSRRLVREACSDWSLAEQPGAEVVASELVTNCVVHGRTSCTLSITVDHRGLTVSARDPMPAPAGGAAAWEVGGGLRVVGAIAGAWGVWPHAGGGKAVWATLPLTVATG